MVLRSVIKWASNKLISIATNPLKRNQSQVRLKLYSLPLFPPEQTPNHFREIGNKWLWSSFMESNPKKLAIKIRASGTKSKTTIINIFWNLIRVQQKSKPCLNDFPGQVHYSRAANAQHRGFFCITKQIKGISAFLTNANLQIMQGKKNSKCMENMQKPELN